MSDDKDGAPAQDELTIEPQVAEQLRGASELGVRLVLEFTLGEGDETQVAAALHSQITLSVPADERLQPQIRMRIDARQLLSILEPKLGPQASPASQLSVARPRLIVPGRE